MKTSSIDLRRLVLTAFSSHAFFTAPEHHRRNYCFPHCEGRLLEKYTGHQIPQHPAPPEVSSGGLRENTESRSTDLFETLRFYAFILHFLNVQERMYTDAFHPCLILKLTIFGSESFTIAMGLRRCSPLPRWSQPGQ